ncbi:MAG: 30S ribosome-binding factor RbfA [Candidatus Kapaibacterium sp.]|jgi:ribosome-binding factor A
MSIRTEKVAGEIQRAIAKSLQNELSDLSDGLLTVTKVRMSPDLRSGRVYLSILGSVHKPADVLKRVKDQAYRIRMAVGREVRLKFTPELFYYIDDTMEEVSHLEDIFRQIRLTNPRSSEPNGEESGTPPDGMSANGTDAPSQS